MLGLGKKDMRNIQIEGLSWHYYNGSSSVPLFTKQYKLVPYLSKLRVKQALYTTHWPHVRGLAASTGVWLRATETEISTAIWALVTREGL